jgi:hypothetical protein
VTPAKIPKIIFFLNRKYASNVTIVATILLSDSVSERIPAGNKIIFDITAEIIPIETHLIQLKTGLFVFMFFALNTPMDLHK